MPLCNNIARWRSGVCLHGPVVPTNRKRFEIQRTRKDSCYKWFISDIAVFLYYPLYKSRLVTNQEHQKEFIEYFLPQFWNGYCSENRLSEEWTSRIQQFIKLRDAYLCIIINGTIRNECHQDNYFCLDAKVLNVHLEEVGPIVSESAPALGFTVVFAKKNSTSIFDLQIPYETTDIAEYELFVKYAPMEFSPP